MEEAAAAVREGDPSLSPLNLSSVPGAVIGYELQEAMLNSLQGHRQQACPLMKYLDILMQQNISRTVGGKSPLGWGTGLVYHCSFLPSKAIWEGKGCRGFN